MRPGPHPTSRLSAERMIAAVRVVLAATSLLAIWLDPAEPARFAAFTYSIHAGYLFYALAAATWTRRRSIGNAFTLATHSFDVFVFSMFQYLTLGPSSPFFVYFIFSLFCGAIRWGWRGSFVTAIVVTTAYVVMGVSMSRTLGPLEFELNRFIIRIAYLVVTAGLLVYLGRYEARLSGEIERLARWPSASGPNVRDVLERVSEHAARILGAGRAVVAWEAEDEPSIHIVSWSPDGTSVTRHAPDELTSLVAGGGAAAFLRTGPPGEEGGTLVGTGGRVAQSTELQIHPIVESELKGAGLAAAPFRTDRVSGWVFFTDIRTATPEIIPLAEVVGREVGASLDQLHVTRQLQEIAASEERIRVARDLHDGVLQSLTGIRLELRAIAASLNDEASTPRDRLFAIERALAIEQRELRFFIGDLSPAPAEAAGKTERPDATLGGRLELLRERVAAEWKVPVTIRVGPDLVPIPATISEAIPLMVHEAVVNALKHAHPSRVIVAVEHEPGGILRIVVSDDGHGFPFRGRYDHQQLTRTNTAPASLLERITSLGGEMSIESTDAGSRVEMRLTV